MTKYEVDFQAEDWPAELICVLELMSRDAESVLNTMDLVEESIDREITSLKRFYGELVAHLGKHPDSLFYLTGECKEIVENVSDLIEAYHNSAKKKAAIEKVWERCDMAEIPEIPAK